MLVDLTLSITPQIAQDIQSNFKKVGHLGTHFDVMDKEFPLEDTELQGIVFDISHINNRDIKLSDIAIEKVRPNMFVAFYSGFIDTEEYGGKRYLTEHPQLSVELIDALLEKGISIIGVDFAGVRRGKEHRPTDQRCANHGVFIVENLCNLKSIINMHSPITICTYPMNFTGLTGLPCRVIAKTV